MVLPIREMMTTKIHLCCVSCNGFNYALNNIPELDGRGHDLNFAKYCHCTDVDGGDDQPPNHDPSGDWHIICPEVENSIRRSQLVRDSNTEGKPVRPSQGKREG